MQDTTGLSRTDTDTPPVEFPPITEELRQRVLEHAQAGAELNAALEKHFLGKEVDYRDPDSTHHGIYKVSSVGWNHGLGFTFRIHMPKATFRSSRTRGVSLDELKVVE